MTDPREEDYARTYLWFGAPPLKPPQFEPWGLFLTGDRDRITILPPRVTVDPWWEAIE